MKLRRPVDESEIQRFWEDGVVCLRGILPNQWVRELEDALTEVQERRAQGVLSMDYTEIAKAASAKGEPLLGNTEMVSAPDGRFLVVAGAWTFSPKMRAIGVSGPLPEIAGALLRSRVVRFYDDQILIKEPGCKEYSAFHTDEAYWRLTGDHVLGIWVSPDVVTEDSGAMRYVRGSHRSTQSFHARDFVTGNDVTFRSISDHRTSIDVELHEDDFDILTMPTNPGDAIVHHYRIVHGSRGNYSPTSLRRAASLRYCGDDVRYKDKPGATDKVYHGSGHLKNNDPLDDAHFPVVWRGTSG